MSQKPLGPTLPHTARAPSLPRRKPGSRAPVPSSLPHSLLCAFPQGSLSASPLPQPVLSSPPTGESLASLGHDPPTWVGGPGGSLHSAVCPVWGPVWLRVCCCTCAPHPETPVQEVGEEVGSRPGQAPGAPALPGRTGWVPRGSLPPRSAPSLLPAPPGPLAHLPSCCPCEVQGAPSCRVPGHVQTWDLASLASA